MQCFENKIVIVIVIVTGAGTGIGAAPARRFLREGATVVLDGRREQKLRETIAGTDTAKSLIHAGTCRTRRTSRGLSQTPSPASAGSTCWSTMPGSQSSARSRADYRRMAASAGDRPQRRLLRYARGAATPSENRRLDRQRVVRFRPWRRLGRERVDVAKGAVFNLTRSLGLEYAARGVRVNAVASSLTTTDATANLEKSEAAMGIFRSRLPIGRTATPDEVAAVIAFPASDDVSFVNGVILPVDGGLAASSGQPHVLALFRQG